MFTLHEIDRQGNPARELARSPFIDVMEVIALGMARKYWSEDERMTQEIMDADTKRYVVCLDGEATQYVVLREHTQRRWELVSVDKEGQ